MFGKSTLRVIGLLSIFVFSAFNTNYHAKRSIRTVVIDAGHGGHDGGCKGSTANEKHIALAIAKAFGELIEKNMPNVKVIYTRKADVFVELHERASIANRNNADVFLSIHCNSGPKTAYGTETFAMGLHVSKTNLDVAMRENAVILLEDNYEQTYEGFDPRSAEGHIIFSMLQNAYLDHSLKLAETIENQFKTHAKRHSRGVKQAGFMVLARTSMPSVLVETGFLTNIQEEKFLISHQGQRLMAESLFKAFQTYKVNYEKY